MYETSEVDTATECRPLQNVKCRLHNGNHSIYLWKIELCAYIVYLYICFKSYFIKQLGIFLFGYLHLSHSLQTTRMHIIQTHIAIHHMVRNLRKLYIFSKPYKIKYLLAIQLMVLHIWNRLTDLEKLYAIIN